LEGKTRKEVARQLRWPEGTVNGRLSRGRALLARRLKKHGVSLAGGALAGLIAQQSASACSSTLLRETVKAGLDVAAGASASQFISIKVLTLTEGMLKTMLLKKLKLVTLTLLAAGFVAIGVGMHGRQGKVQAADGPTTTAGPVDPALTDNHTGRLVF